MPITKATYLVRESDKIADVIRQAFAVAANGRPGPVLIDFLKNVTAPDIMVDYEFTPWSQNRECESITSYTQTHGLKSPKANQEDIAQLVEMIRMAERPMVISGGGVVRSRADSQITQFAETINCPVASTVMGAGAFSDKHPLSTGMVGMHGSEASNYGIDSCDLLIVVGSRFSDRVALDTADFAKQAKIVQIDIDRAEIDKNVKTYHHIIGSARKVLIELNQQVGPREMTPWAKQILSMKRTAPVEPIHSEGINPQQVLTMVANMAPEETIVATDVGQHQMWAIQHFRFVYSGQLLTSGGFGTMGFGLGAAIGAQMGNPKQTVIHITGDGCFRMNCHELCTVEHYNLPIISIIFNNGSLGMVRQWQNLIYNKRFSATTLDRGPDFVKLAEAYGLKGFRVNSVAEMEEALAEALKGECGAVIDVNIDCDTMVRPMVAGGSKITAFLLGEEEQNG